MMEELKRLFEEKIGRVKEIRKLAGGGGSRIYYRITGEKETAIGVDGNDLRENEIFLRLDAALHLQNVNVPDILAVSPDKKYYLLQDLGDISLFDLLKGPDRMYLAQKALKELTTLQTLEPAVWEPEVGFPPFSERLVRWDLNYFKYDFLKPYGISFDEENLENDFDLLTSRLTSQDMIKGFMYRDFQSRNVLVKNGELWFIDFQGARKGPVAYDAVSFIWQAKAPFSFEEREKLGNFYINEYCSAAGAKSADSLRERLGRQMILMQIFRTLQVLGAYGFRGLIEKKAHFIESIPPAVKNLEYLKTKGYLSEFPEISKICDLLVEKQEKSATKEDGRLEVKVFSFSYKKGYPEDLSGNGGGFMFDCRAIHNPGRYEEYKRLTGRDAEVIEFLERTDEAADFVRNALAISVPSIERYLKRGFTSLQVGFGCTGGQHRSVYCAERYAREIKKMFPEIKVALIHREQQ